jgi:[ribosomal protein S5]-alanine N-acetyltransferase
MDLKSPRLTLRPQEQADAPALFAILKDEHAMRFWNRPAIARLVVVEELVREQQVAMAAGLCCYWTLIQDGDPIGSVDLSLIQDGSAELGFLLRRDRWCAGLATEAVGTVIAHGFGALALTRLAAAIQRENRAAARVLEKNVFRRVELRSVTLANSQSRDCEFYLRTRETI